MSRVRTRQEAWSKNKTKKSAGNTTGKSAGNTTGKSTGKTNGKSAEKAAGNTAGRRKVTFLVEAGPDSQVYVAGSFNSWDPRKNRLEYDGERAYSISMMLPRGTHEYKFVIDDVWCVDPECPDWTANGVGSLNSVVTIL